MMNHLCDEHEDCYHTNDLGNRHKKWFIPGKGNKTKLDSTMHMSCITGTKAWEKLSDIIGNHWLMSDIKELSPSQQTSSVKSYCITV